MSDDLPGPRRPRPAARRPAPRLGRVLAAPCPRRAGHARHRRSHLGRRRVARLRREERRGGGRGPDRRRRGARRARPADAGPERVHPGHGRPARAPARPARGRRRGGDASGCRASSGCGSSSASRCSPGAATGRSSSSTATAGSWPMPAARAPRPAAAAAAGLPLVADRRSCGEQPAVGDQLGRPRPGRRDAPPVARAGRRRARRRRPCWSASTSATAGPLIPTVDGPVDGRVRLLRPRDPRAGDDPGAGAPPEEPPRRPRGDSSCGWSSRGAARAPSP